MRGAIIAAGGPSLRMGRPKALVPVDGVPLITRVIEAAARAVEEIVVVAKPPDTATLRSIVSNDIRVIDDERREQSPLVGLITGARALSANHAAYLACDLPLLVPALLHSLFAAAPGHDAVIPRWPDGRIEPMVAVYGREAARTAAAAALGAGRYANTDMISRLARVQFISTEELRAADPVLDSFVNVNSPSDITEAEARLRRRRG